MVRDCGLARPSLLSPPARAWAAAVPILQPHVIYRFLVDRSWYMLYISQGRYLSFSRCLSITRSEVHVTDGVHRPSQRVTKGDENGVQKHCPDAVLAHITCLLWALP